MHWNKLRVIITNEDGEVFALHELGPVAASQLQEIADHAADSSHEGDEDVVRDLLADIETAADNVRRGAVTDDNNLIVSEAAP